MVEKYLGKDLARGIFMAGATSYLQTEKKADVLGSIGNAVGNIGKGLLSTGKEILPALGWTMALGGASGVLGATAYDVIKEHVSHEDPEAKLNSELETQYKAKNREIQDAKWMSRIRALRDELRRGKNRMPTDEYTKKYKELLALLDERSGNV